MNADTPVHIPAALPSPRAPRWGVGLLMLAAAGGCKSRPGKAAAADTTQMAVGPENIAILDTGSVITGPVISGSLTAQRQATIRAEVSGPVVQTYAEKGQPVKRGDLIARIDDTAIRDTYLSARSAVVSAQDAATNAQRNLERTRTLEQAGALATRDVETAQSTLTAATAQLADAKARLASAQKQLANTEIRAPFGGIVSDRPVNAGDVVQPGTAIATVVDPSSMQLVASVPAEAIRQLHIGQPVSFTVSGYPNRQFDGHIDRINPVADPATRQVTLYVTIPNAGNSLVGGLFAQGRVASDTRHGLLAPVSAVDQTGIGASVVRVHEGKAQRVAVQLGARDEQTNMVEISGAVARGDTLLLGAAHSVTPGTPVRVTQFADSAASAGAR